MTFALMCTVVGNYRFSFDVCEKKLCTFMGHKGLL